MLEAMVSGRAMGLDEKLGAHPVRELIANGTLTNSGTDLNFDGVVYGPGSTWWCQLRLCCISARLQNVLRQSRILSRNA